MRILITGAMGVGKTTLANHIAEARGYKILPEVARIMAEEGYKLDKEITPEIELEMLRRQVLLEQEEDYIADRGLIDLLAYCLILFPEETELLNKVNLALADAVYDTVIYLEPEFPIEDDGLRSTDVAFQKQIDETIKFILSTSAFKHHKVSGSKTDRLNQVLDKLLIIEDKTNI